MQLKVNDIYPTDESLEHFYKRAKAQIPVADVNELIALLAIHQNTILRLVETQPNSQGTTR